MTLDLRADTALILDYLKRRIEDYPVYINAGPGQDDATITQITLGHSFDQSGWVALVFDTRLDAQCDGAWQAFIEETSYKLPHWCTSIETLRERGKHLPVTLPGGSKTTIAPDAEQEHVAGVFGKMLHKVLSLACKEKAFTGLPLAKSCLVAIEEHEGAWGWLGKFDGKTLKVAKGPGGPQEQMLQAAAKFSGAKQVDFWMGVLGKLAAGKKCYVKPDIVGCGNATYEAARLGKKMTMPFLRLATKWAHECEFVANEALSNRRPHGFIIASMLS